MGKKNTSIYIIIAAIGLLLLWLAQRFSAQMADKANDQITLLERKVNQPRKKIPVAQNEVSKKVAEVTERIEEANKPDAIARRKANIDQIKKDRAEFLKQHRLSFPGDPRAFYIVSELDKSGNHSLMEIGHGSSYTLALFTTKAANIANIKSAIVKKLNVTSDEFVALDFKTKATNGLRNQSLYEIEKNGLYHMIYLATHPSTSEVITMHFTIKEMSKVIEDYVNKRFSELRAI